MSQGRSRRVLLSVGDSQSKAGGGERSVAMVVFKLQDYVLINCVVAFILSSITNYHRFSGSNNKPLFLTVPESGKAEIK